MNRHSPTDIYPTRRYRRLTVSFRLALGLPLAASTAPAQETSQVHKAQAGAWAAVDQALGREGTDQRRTTR